MVADFSLQERCALYGLIAENSKDIVFKTDARGFIIGASHGIDRLGFHLPGMLIGPHLRDLVQAHYAGVIETELFEALQGAPTRWVECPARARRAGWFAIHLRGLRDGEGRIYGTLGMMRCIADRKSLEDRLFAAELTDRLTGLTNRLAFVAMLDHMVQTRSRGSIALFDIDHLKTINMRCGHAAGDEVLVAFAGLLKAVTRRDDIISRIDGERFGVLMPGLSATEAREICEPVIETLADIRHSGQGSAMPVTASGGIGAITHSLDSSMRRAEVALFFAKARGRCRLEVAASEPEQLRLAA